MEISVTLKQVCLFIQIFLKTTDQGSINKNFNLGICSLIIGEYSLNLQKRVEYIDVHSYSL